MQQNLARFGTQFRWTAAQKLRSGFGNGLDYREIAKRFIENGCLLMCSTCARECKMPAPTLPVAFTCYDYQAGGEVLPKPSERLVRQRAHASSEMPPRPPISKREG